MSLLAHLPLLLSLPELPQSSHSTSSSVPTRALLITLLLKHFKTVSGFKELPWILHPFTNLWYGWLLHSSCWCYIMFFPSIWVTQCFQWSAIWDAKWLQGYWYGFLQSQLIISSNSLTILSVNSLTCDLKWSHINRDDYSWGHPTA